MTARGYEQDEALRVLKERIRRLELKEARNRPASGVSVADPGGFFGGPGGLTIEDVIALIGAGTAPDAFLRNTLGGLDIVQPLGTLGATETIDLANASVFWGTMDQDVTISTTGWTNLRNATILVELIEDGTGDWLPTFSGVTWIDGAPTAAAAGEVIQVVLRSRDGGTTIWGSVVGGGSGNFPGDVFPHGSMGATETLDYGDGTAHTGTIDDDVTMDFAGFIAGKDCGITFLVTEDGTGGHTLAFTGVTWIGTTPTHDDTAGTSEVYGFICLDGSTILGGKIGDGGGAIALDDLTDVVITAVAADDTLQYDGSDWVNSSRRWEPVTTNPGGGPELVWTGDDIVMTWRTY